MKKVFTKLMNLSIVALLLNSCYIKEDIPFVPPVVENPTEYVVTIYTVDASNSNAPMDIALPLFGINSSQVTRVATGTYEFKPTSAGTFSFKASKSGYYDAFGNVTLPKGDANEVISSSVIVPLTQITTPTTPDAAKYTLWGRVLKGVDNSNLNPTTVTCTLRGEVVSSTITITNNLFKIEFPKAGVYDITVNAAGYESVTLTQNISKIPDGQEFVSELTVPMYLIGTLQGQTYSVRGTVMNINHVVQLGATMATQIDGVNTTVALPNGTYEVLGLTNNKNISFVFAADSCYPSAFQLSISQYSGTPNIIYDVFLKPVPAGSAVQSQIVLPDPGTGSIGSDPIVITTPSTSPIPNQPVNMSASITIPANSTLTNASNQLITSPIAFSANAASQLVPAVALSDNSDLGVSLFTLGIEPKGITSSNPMHISITNPFGSLEVDETYLASTSEATTKSPAAIPGIILPINRVPSIPQFEAEVGATNLFVGFTKPATAAVISATLIDDGQYTEDFYNKTGTNLTDVKYEYYAKTGNVYAPGYTPEELVNAANLYFKSAEEKATLLQYIKTTVSWQLGETSYSLTPVKTVRETNTDCASNQYMKTTTAYKYSERQSTIKVTDSNGSSVNLVVKVRSYITSSIFELDLYNASHTTGSHITNNGAGGGYGSSNL